MNPLLETLQPYPFEKLRRLFADAPPPPQLAPIALHIGEPRHATPPLIAAALTEHLDGLARYPASRGEETLREACADWLGRRYNMPPPDPASRILPVNGTREALFAFAQAVVDASAPAPLVMAPNPFYQIYEGAALLAGARPYFINTVADDDWAMDWERPAASDWRDCQLVYVCSPGNPTGAVISLSGWRRLFELADRHDFIIAADECYAEIYDPAGPAPIGALQAAHQLGRDDFRRLIVFNSLSKRSNAPGLRSGFVAGDAALISKFLLYRTYHGCAMSPPLQAASFAAWRDEAHVIDNRRLYAAKFASVTPLLAQHLDVSTPAAGFYLWASVAPTGLADDEFARRLHHQYNVAVLPGAYLGREVDGFNPGAGHVRIALVDNESQCIEAAQRILAFCSSI